MANTPTGVGSGAAAQDHADAVGGQHLGAVVGEGVGAVAGVVGHHHAALGARPSTRPAGGGRCRRPTRAPPPGSSASGPAAIVPAQAGGAERQPPGEALAPAPRSSPGGEQRRELGPGLGVGVRGRSTPPRARAARAHAAIRPPRPPRAAASTSRPTDALPVASTSRWSSASADSPAAMLVTSDTPNTSAPRWRAAIASSTVDMPTRSAPSVAQHPDLGGRLVAAAEQAGVDALGDARRGGRRRGPQARAVEVGEVAEPRREALRRIGPAHRVRAGQVEVVADQHRRARAVRRHQRAGGVREQHGAGSRRARPPARRGRPWRPGGPRRGASGPPARAAGPRRRRPSAPCPLCPCTDGAGKPGSSGIGTLARVSPEPGDHVRPPGPQHEHGPVLAEPLADRRPRRPARRE